MALERFGTACDNRATLKTGIAVKKPTILSANKPAAASPAKTQPTASKTAAKAAPAKATAVKAAPPRALTAGQQAYEAKRAKKAGMSVERWLTSKQRAQESEAREKAKAAEPPKPVKPPGLLARLLDRAHKPLR